jgi:hypothetical protein
MRVVFA